MWIDMVYAEIVIPCYNESENINLLFAACSKVVEKSDFTINFIFVDNGSTVVIGGLYQTSTLETISGIPFLKDLPLVGWLFRTPYAPDTSKNELIIFMTPRVMNQEEAGFTDRQTTNTISNPSKEI
jgi:type II secretory pathway component GspD/PulD (secretin)